MNEQTTSDYFNNLVYKFVKERIPEAVFQGETISCKNNTIDLRSYFARYLKGLKGEAKYSWIDEINKMVAYLAA